MKRFLVLFLFSFNAFAIDLVTTAMVEQTTPIIVVQSSEPVTEVIADKKNGAIYIKQPGQETISSPALFGKTFSDDVTKWETEYVTPAGTYELQKAFSPRMNSYILTFLRGKKTVNAIHPVYLGNKTQQRWERLNNGTAEDNRITNGCINVLPDFFQLLYTLPTGTKLIVLREEESFTP